MPLDLRREELVVRELIKIMMKDKKEDTAKCFDTWKYQIEESTEKVCLPLTRPLCSGQIQYQIQA